MPTWVIDNVLYVFFYTTSTLGLGNRFYCVKRAWSMNRSMFLHVYNFVQLHLLKS